VDRTGRPACGSPAGRWPLAARASRGSSMTAYVWDTSSIRAPAGQPVACRG
jgi:hypothetical protein